MHDKNLALQLVRDALLLEEPQRAELLELLSSSLVSDSFVGEVINVLGKEQEAFSDILTSMSDDEVTQLGMSVVHAKAEKAQAESRAEAATSAGAAESLLSES